MTKYIWGSIVDDAAEKYISFTGKKGVGMTLASLVLCEENMNDLKYKSKIRNGISQLPEHT